jgi:hypothetical protein
MPLNPKTDRPSHKMETIKKLMEIAKTMEIEDAQNFKKKKQQPPQQEAASEGAE